MNMRNARIIKGECPSCRAIIEIEEDLKEFEYIDCPNCYELLEVISLNPLNFQIAYLGDEDPYCEDEYLSKFGE